MNIYKDNRELSWLKFNDRVLMQAKDDSVLLGERLTFISIFQTNLDEFFRVRMGFLFDQDLFYPALKENKTNMTSSEQIKACERKVKYLYKKRDKIYASNLEKMKEYGIAKRTVQEAKKIAEIEAYKKGKIWYWHMEVGDSI